MALRRAYYSKQRLEQLEGAATSFVLNVGNKTDADLVALQAIDKYILSYQINNPSIAVAVPAQ